MTRVRHKRTHHARRDVSRAARTRARKLDPDQIQANMNNATVLATLQNPTSLDVDKPGLGLFYCVPCDRHFPSEVDREKHTKSKLHKRVAKKMENETAYTVEESMRAAGIGIDNRQRGAEDDKKKKEQDAAMNATAAAEEDEEANPTA